ncbi:MAG: rhamnulokinase [Christensenellales bacterium]|jgi:rhamnulokinase
MRTRNFIAADLGASNGRTILGRFNGKKFTLTELNRFNNNYIRIGDAYYWDVLYLYTCIKQGMQIYAGKYSGALSGFGIDTWGVDFGLIDRQGRLIGNPRSYRDPRGARGFRFFYDKYDEKTVFNLTGIANLAINTAYHLHDMVVSKDPQLEIADKLLLIPDLLSYMFSGTISTEFTNATTMQMLSLSGTWSKEMIKMVGIPDTLLSDIQKSGEIKGRLIASIANEIGFSEIPAVICVGSHDTASAVASVPTTEDDFAFISSGTWSLIGVLSDTPIINDHAHNNHFSNEGTVEGRYRPLRNIMGLWIIQCCKRQWERKEKLDWDDIVNMARTAPASSRLSTSTTRSSLRVIICRKKYSNIARIRASQYPKQKARSPVSFMKAWQ